MTESSGYRAIRDAWLRDPAFQQKVIATGDPTFLNRDNDPEVFRVYDQLLWAGVDGTRPPDASDAQDPMRTDWVRRGTALENIKETAASRPRSADPGSKDLMREIHTRLTEPRFRRSVLNATNFLNDGWQIVDPSLDRLLPDYA